MEVEYIKSLKEAKKLKVKDLSEMTNIPESTINNFLSRKTENPSLSMMAKLCVAVGGSLDEMMGLKELAEKTEEQQNAKELLSSITDAYEKRISELKDHITELKDDKLKLNKIILSLCGIIVCLVIFEFILGLYA